MAIEINSGSYGVVYDVGDDIAVKKSTLFHDTIMSTNNLAEAVFAANQIKRKLDDNVVTYIDVQLDVNGAYLSILMEKGEKTLYEYIRKTPYTVRMEDIESHVNALVRALFFLHERGFVLLDIKPGNIVICADKKLKIIDFGSLRSPTRNAWSRLYGTTAFSAPEILDGRKLAPTTACDAYSLGATIHFMIYKKHVVNDFFKDGMKLPDKRPDGVPARVFDDMLALLNADPKKRPSLASLYYRDAASIEVIDVAPNIMAPVNASSSAERDTDIDKVHAELEANAQLNVFGLTVNIMDRYAEIVHRRPTSEELDAFRILAVTVIDPDVVSEVNVKSLHARMAIAKVLRTLRFQIYADTCDWLLKTIHGHPKHTIDFELLKKVLKESGGITAKSVELYKQSRDFVDIIDV
eukprot:gene19538-26219_t